MTIEPQSKTTENPTPEQDTTTATPANFDPAALDTAVNDIAGMIGAAMRAAVSGDCDTDAIFYLLQNADRRLESEVLPAIAGRAASGPVLAPVASNAQDAPRDDLYEAQQAAEGATTALAGLAGMLTSLATSDSDEETLRDCLFSARELVRPIRKDACRALDLITDHRRALRSAKIGH